MSYPVAIELDEPSIVINDNCGGICNQWVDDEWNNEKLDYHLCEDVAEEGRTWREKGKNIVFEIKPGFSVEIKWTYENYNDWASPNTWTQDIEESYDCRTNKRRITVGFNQKSDCSLQYYCEEGSPQIQGNHQTHHIITGSGITVTLTPCFSGLGILSDGDPLGISVYADADGNILRAG